MSASTLITFPATVKPGETFEIRATIRHPMETGYRRGADGEMLARDLIRRFSAHFEVDGKRELVFSTELFAAIAANPFLAFPMRAERSGTLVLTWEGDDNFSHSERMPLTVR